MNWVQLALEEMGENPEIVFAVIVLIVLLYLILK